MNLTSSFEREIAGSIAVSGTPVCRGLFTGIARVVTRLEDAKNIKKVRFFFNAPTS